MSAEVEIENTPGVSVIAVDNFGDRVLASMRYHENINYFDSAASIETVMTKVADSAMVIIVTGADSSDAVGKANRIARFVQEHNGVDISIVPGLEAVKFLTAADIVLPISDNSLIPLDGTSIKLITSDSLQVYLARVLIRELIEIVVEQGIICFDLADLKYTLCERSTLVGIGLARGDNRAINAAAKALQAIELQNGKLDEIRAIVAIYNASSSVTLDEIAKSDEFLYGNVPFDNVNIVAALTINDALGENFRVILLAASRLKHIQCRHCRIVCN